MRYLEIGTGENRHHTFNTDHFKQADLYVTVDPMNTLRPGHWSTHNKPIPHTLRDSRTWGSKESQISIERMIEASQKTKFLYDHVIADGENLPFPEDSFDEAVIANIVGDPAVFWFSSQGIVEECMRVAKQVLIVETRTPRIAEIVMDKIDGFSLHPNLPELVELIPVRESSIVWKSNS